MLQFLAAKDAYPDSMLFFRLGDFYEMFFDDAYRAAELLGITQSFRGTDPDGNRIPMAGVPHHAAAGYITKLLKLGHKVAICEQMADPSTVKGVVPREVVRVITPGLCLEEGALEANEDNYLVALCGAEGEVGLAAFELSTGDLRACRLPDDAAAIAELVRLDAREVIFPAKGLDGLWKALGEADLQAVCRREDLSTQGVLLDVIGADENALEEFPVVREAAARALAYARIGQPGVPLVVQRVGTYDPRSYLVLDDVAVRNLEIVKTLAGDRRGALLHFVDDTNTAMGARLLRRRLLAPLTEIAAIRRRHDLVEVFVADAALRASLRDALRGLPDLERLTTRATARVASPRDLGSIRDALERVGALKEALAAQATIDDVLSGILPEDCCSEILSTLRTALAEELPTHARDGGIIGDGVNEALDEDRRLSANAKDVLLELEARERKRTGIASLKIKFNKVFGYYLEVTRSNLGLVPGDYVRKQTVANGERYVTDELLELQERITYADERSKSLEQELFEELRVVVARSAMELRALAGRVAALDVATGLAEVAHRYGYCRPTVDDGTLIELKNSRHPVVERLVGAGTFVPNDVRLDLEGERLMIITGPNMSGKSTAMRQVALTVILAQAGAFVPASAAQIGIADRVFTRVGASDNLGAGQSTFMVEMREAAEILRAATSRSLVILDEIGRGTSTYDGLAIAWAIAEHLHDVIGCRGMFATHYHELCELAEICGGAANYNVAAKEYGDDVIFLHKLVQGSANRSYGVAVARLAGLPAIVLARAKALLGELERGAALPSGAPARVRPLDAQGRTQLDLFVRTEPVRSRALDTLAELEPDRLTPVDALVALARLREMLREDQGK